MRAPKLGTVLLLLALAGMLGFAGYFAWRGLAEPGEPLPGHFLFAMILGTVFSIAIGSGLMALVFYSSRHGYDEPPDFRK
jgi:hypothetical protein